VLPKIFKQKVNYISQPYYGGIITKKEQPVIERVQALTDILRSVLYAFAVYKTISLYTCMLS